MSEEKLEQNAALKADETAELQMPLWKANFWYVIIWLTMILDMVDRQAINAILPLLKKEFLLTDAQVGLISSIFGISISALVFPIAVLCDRWSRRKMMAFMVGFWSVATWFTGKADSYIHLLLARLAVGSGEAGYGPPAFALISAWYPKTIRGTMLGLFNTAKPLGSAAGMALAGYLAYYYGWRSMFGMLAIPGLIIAAMFWFMPDYKAQKADAGKDEEVKVSLKEVMFYILKTKTLVMVFIIGATVFIFENTFQIWSVTYFARTFGLNVKEAGAAVGLIGLLGCMGSPISGWIGDKMLKYSPKGRIYTAMVLTVFMVVFMFVALKSKDYRTVFIFWTAAMFLLPGIQINFYTITQDLVPPYARGIAFAFVPIFNWLLAGVWAPVAAGKLSDMYGLASALQIVAVVSFVLAEVFLFLALRYYMADLARFKALGTFKLRQG